jgi:hypothetical protein
LKVAEVISDVQVLESYNTEVYQGLSFQGVVEPVRLGDGLVKLGLGDFAPSSS